HAEMGAGAVPITSGRIGVVAGQIQEQARAEEVAARLREVRAFVAVVAGEVEDHADAAGKVVRRGLRVGRKNAPAQAHGQTECVPLKCRVVGFGLRRVGLIVAAGVFLAALVTVVTTDIDDGADAGGAAEPERVAPARVLIVAIQIEKEADAADGRSLREARAEVLVVARGVAEDANARETNAT